MVEIMNVVLLVCVVLGVVGPGNVLAEEPMKKLLLTGFEPFGKYKRNVSWEAIKELDGKEINNYKIKAVCFPVNKSVSGCLEQEVERFKPDIVISFGLHPRLVDEICIETEAQIGTAHTVRGRAPFKRIAQKLEAKKVKTVVSKDAGKYICEYLWECLLTHRDLADNKVFFVHVPNIDLQKLKVKVRKTIETILEEM